MIVAFAQRIERARRHADLLFQQPMEHRHRIYLFRQFDPKNKPAARQRGARPLRKIAGDQAARLIHIGGVAAAQRAQVVIVAAVGEEFRQRLRQQPGFRHRGDRLQARNRLMEAAGGDPADAKVRRYRLGKAGAVNHPAF